MKFINLRLIHYYMKLPSKIQFADNKVKEAFEELAKYGKDEKGLY